MTGILLFRLTSGFGLDGAGHSRVLFLRESTRFRQRLFYRCDTRERFYGIRENHQLFPFGKSSRAPSIPSRETDFFLHAKHVFLHVFPAFFTPFFHVLTSRREKTKPDSEKRIYHIWVPALNTVSISPAGCFPAGGQTIIEFIGAPFHNTALAILGKPWYLITESSKTTS